MKVRLSTDSIKLFSSRSCCSTLISIAGAGWHSPFPSRFPILAGRWLGECHRHHQQAWPISAATSAISVQPAVRRACLADFGDVVLGFPKLVGTVRR
jgi:hypothetical protein